MGVRETPRPNSSDLPDLEDRLSRSGLWSFWKDVEEGFRGSKGSFGQNWCVPTLFTPLLASTALADTSHPNQIIYI